MLEIIYGRAGSGKTAYCLNAIKKELLQSPFGRPIILLLPEHMTYKVERQLASMMSEAGSGFVRCHVYGFRRFAYQVLANNGGGLESGLTELGKHLLLKKIINRRLNSGGDNSGLQAFNRAGRQKGFVKALGKMIDELKSYGVSPEKLSETRDLVDDKRLQNKLGDLSLLADDFAKEMEGRFNDKGDMLNRLIEKIPVVGDIKGADIWLDGFLFFNPQECLIIQELMRQAENVHVTMMLDTDRLHENWENIKPIGTFYRSYRSLHDLQNIAAELGVEIERTPLKSNVRHDNFALQRIESCLYGLPKKTEKDFMGENEQRAAVKVIEAANVRLEQDAVAADIRRLVREKGYKWKDIGILIRDDETYGASLPLILRDYDIPFFSDKKRPCSNHPLAELIRSALSILRNGWQYDAMFRCIKTGFFTVSRSEIDLLENYVLEFGIRGMNRWTKGDWTAVRHFNLDDDEVSDLQQQRLNLINDIRLRVIKPLQHLEEAVKEAGNTAVVTRALYGFLLELQVPEALEEWSQEAEKMGRLAEAKEHAQVWKDFIALLDQLVELSGDEPMSKAKLADYESVLGEGLDALQVSLIPPGLDYVTIASFDQNSLDNAKAIFILGAVAGAMPRRTTENPILSDGDRLKLEELARRQGENSTALLSVVARDNSFNEKYLIYKAFTQASEYLCVSYPLSDAAGKGMEPSNIVKKIRELLPVCGFMSIPLETMDWREDLQDLLIAEGRSAVSALVPALRTAREQRRPLNEIWRQVYNWGLANEPDAVENIKNGLFFKAEKSQLPRNIAKLLFTKRNVLKASVSKLESYNQCPFKYFSQYGLKLEERQEYKFRSLDFGKLLHAVLQGFGEKMKAADRRWGSVPEEECRSICRDILLEKASRLQNGIMLSSKQKQVQLNRIYDTACRVLLHQCAYDRESKFHPSEFERMFDTSDQKEKMAMLYQLIDDCKLAIRGTIDRIDRGEAGSPAEDLFTIIDYKSSAKSMSLAEVYYGLNMQLITYMLVAENILRAQEGKPILPGAILYAILSVGMVTNSSKLTDEEAQAELQKKMRMKGWIMLQKDIMQQLDPKRNFVLDVTSVKKEYTKSSMECMFTPNEFRLIMKYVVDMLVKTGNSIVSGDIQAAPVKIESGAQGGKGACKYCSYKPVCCFSPDISGYKGRFRRKREKDELMTMFAKPVNTESSDWDEDTEEEE